MAEVIVYMYTEIWKLRGYVLSGIRYVVLTNLFWAVPA